MDRSLSTRSELPAKSDAAARSPLLNAPVDDPLDGMPRAAVARTEAKAEIISFFRAKKGLSCRTLNATGASFVERYNHGEIEVSAATRALYPIIKWPTLQRDWRKFEKSGIASLIPGYKGGKNIIASNPTMREFVLAQISHNPLVRGRFVHEGILAKFPSDCIPDLRSVERFIREWKRQNSSLHLRTADPAGWKNRHMLAVGDSDANITRVNQCWEIDGTPADAYVLGTVETPGGRLHMLATIDLRSRRIVAHLAPSESSDALAALLIKAILILGMPDEVLHDNGSGFLSARTQRGVARLGIAWPATPAYSGWKKAFVERGQKTVLHSFFENIPGAIGHNVKEAGQIRDRHGYAPGRGARRNMRKLYRIELTAPELQTMLDQWLEHVYGNRKHSGLGGRTPNEVFAEAERRGQVRRVADDRLLDLLLGEDGVGVVGKKGLRCENAFYFDDALIDHVGHTVQFVRTRDAGKLIVYTADSAPRFICIAVDPEALGLDREVRAIAAKQRQSAVMREGLEELRGLAKKHRPETTWREIIENKTARAAVAMPTESNVQAIPYRSAALKAAAAALEVLDAPAEPTPHDEQTLREGDLALADIEARREIRALQLSDDECDELWIAICREPRVLTVREERFLAHVCQRTPESWADNYETTTEFAALKMRLAMEGDFKCA